MKNKKMAEKVCPAGEGNATEHKGTAEDKKKSLDDDELDSLLDDALQDFNKPRLVSCPITDQSNGQSTPSKSSSNEHSKGMFAEKAFQDLSSEEGFAKMAEELSKAFKDLPSEDFNFIANLGKSDTDEFSEGTSESKSVEEHIENMWKSMKDNLKETQNESSDDVLGKDFMDAMKGLGLENGDVDTGDFMKSIQGMMTNLLSKDILYPSLKEMQIRYPAWLEENKSKLEESECSRFLRQQEFVNRLCTEFESESEKDSEETKNSRFDKIMELMQKMQECGQPPNDLMGQLENESGASAVNWPPQMENADQCVCM